LGFSVNVATFFRIAAVIFLLFGLISIDEIGPVSRVIRTFSGQLVPNAVKFTLGYSFSCHGTLLFRL
jgi:hypothetical protein